ncbi:MAG: DNA-binding protein [Candidatus Jettenia sp.]|uniref:Helix-turn-helix domain-containing protein n=1 Tax=Candidatus Jettenia caeni TaxID=247490 RepID=I3IJA9_9BACT|nr:helix-turn-helix domain-containing protein [Candidatus Jettenia sp. AMX1]MBC6928860.1 DNA-binding protein [Candidatus Jettenia sp.]GAB61804.1 hypothetical protein KSU1_C0208 [Candidatus Jettenia caeni]KAA0250895.1 MAG: DNA-binding protein [Candidatus Jettenia sp. AMX1]MCE7879862.1 DNA-binding protein [Candidatus Jettenia sp. AMX1]MCQ3926641.1 DNA-binding protein [Candidatus Jettenia sp.]
MRLLKIQEIAEFLNVKESTLYSWAKNGLLPSYKLNGLWRFDIEEIEKWIIQSKALPDTSRKTLKKATKAHSNDIDRIVKNAIDDATGKGYNSANGKPGQSQGLGKERKENGTL